jgi:ABC-type antimicrobial peptide transport system permease subunit
MRYLLSKSRQVIVVNVCTTILITLCLSNFVESFEMTREPSDSLTNQYYSFYIGENRDKIQEKELKMSSMTSYLDSESISFMLQKESNNKITGIYFKNFRFAPEIVSGRNLMDEDYSISNNVILVSQEIETECEIINGKRMYQFENNYYEVVGVYKRSSNKVNIDSYAYYNLLSENIIDGDNNILGQYNLDAGEGTADLTRKLDEYCSITTMKSNIENSFGETIQKVMSTQAFTLFAIIIVILMLTLNSLSFAASWIDNRKPEIIVKKMSGATDKRIINELIRDYILLTSISFIGGATFAYLISKIELEIFTGFDFSILTVLLAFFFVLTMGLITSVVMLATLGQRNIVQARRS